MRLHCPLESGASCIWLAGRHPTSISCAMQGQVKAFQFPPGVFEINKQLLIPPYTSIAGSQNPNDMSSPLRSPDWSRQTLFLATRGANQYSLDYCHAKVHTLEWLIIYLDTVGSEHGKYTCRICLEQPCDDPELELPRNRHHPPKRQWRSLRRRGI